MTLDQVLSEARNLHDESSAEWPFAAVAVGDSLERALSTPDVLVEMAHAIAEEAEARGYSRLIGASRVGDQLAGAAVASSHAGLSLKAAADVDERVMVVDGVLVTGAQIAKVARELRASGTSTIGAVVVLALSVPETARLGIDQLVILEGPMP